MLNVNDQMLQSGFAAGGMKQDPVSGNEVPAGALPHEVRDDVDAKLSEGEFVLPANVVRFIGLERLMKMRDKALEGLNKMEQIGQMGNADEAEANGEDPLGKFGKESEEEDDGFEDEIDDIMGGESESEDGEVEMAVGGVVPSVSNVSVPGVNLSQAELEKIRQQLQSGQGISGLATAGNDVNYAAGQQWKSQTPLTRASWQDPAADKYGFMWSPTAENTYWNDFDTKTGKFQSENPNWFYHAAGMAPEIQKYLRNVGYQGWLPDQNYVDTWSKLQAQKENAQKGGRPNQNEAPIEDPMGIYSRNPADAMNDLKSWLDANNIKYQVGVQKTPGASQTTFMHRLIGPDGKPLVVDAYNDRYNADDRLADAARLAAAVGMGMAAPQMLGLQAGGTAAAATTGAVTSGTNTMLQGGSGSDILKSAAKGGLTGAIAAPVAGYVKEGLSNMWGSALNAMPQGVSDAIMNATGQGLSNATTVVDATGAAIPSGTVAALPTVVTTAPSVASGVASSLPAAVGGALGGVATLPKQEISVKQPEQTTMPTLPATGMTSADKGAIFGKDGYGEGMTGKETEEFDKSLPGNQIDPKEYAKRLFDQAVKAGKIGAGIGAVGGAANLIGGGGSSDYKPTTVIPRGNNPVVDYRPVGDQMEELFINNRPTGRRRKKPGFAVGGDVSSEVNLDAYNFFNQQD